MSRKRRIFTSILQRIILSLTLLLPPAALSQTSSSFSSISIGAFDPDAWNGIVFESKAQGQRLPFALRIGSKSRGFVDGHKVWEMTSLVGPHAPDGSYSLIGWRNFPRLATITLEWSRIDQTTVVGKLKAPNDVLLVLEAYTPEAPYFSGTPAVYTISDDAHEIKGEHFIDGMFGATAKFCLVVDRPLLGAQVFENVTQLQRVMEIGQLTTSSAERKFQSTANTHAPPGAAGVQFVTSENSTTYFVATIGWDSHELSKRAHELLVSQRIDAILSEKARAYDERRPHIKGLFEDAPEPIGNSMFWNSLYVPSLDLEFPSISRNWAHGWGGWILGEWDAFFGSLLTNVEDTPQTSAAVRAILLGQAPNGVVPNINSGAGTTPDRSQLPVGSYIVWKNYQRDSDMELLKWAYPRLKKWHEWWFADRGDGQPYRDGNRNGLLEWGSDRGSTFSHSGRGFRRQAKYETGMDDSPMYDDVVYNPNTYTMELDDVGLNSIYALDSESLARIATILGYEDDGRRFLADYERVRNRIRDYLWNEQDGIYENRYWDGRFSKRLSPTCFYPMVAGVATPEQARRMVREHLTNPAEFWGSYVIPTISRSDPAFADQFYWRGSIWGPTNYLVYQGLNRYSEDELTLAFAEKSYELFMQDWRTNQHTNENYYAWGGSGGGDAHYTWGALLCLIPMEQFIDENPWDGLRFGAFQPAREGQLSGVTWRGHKYDVIIGPKLTVVKRDGKARFEADAGVVLRNYRLENGRVSFSINTPRATVIKLMEQENDSALLKIDDGASKRFAVRNGIVTLTLPTGIHRVSEEWH